MKFDYKNKNYRLVIYPLRERFDDINFEENKS